MADPISLDERRKKKAAGQSGKAGTGRIYENITETVGRTPLVKLNRIAKGAGIGAEILMKLEFFNPLSSVKDRIGVAMIDELEADGRLMPDTVMIEPTSGNTGIALAFVAAARGYRLILTMPESMSMERRQMFTHLGAELQLSPAADGMKGAIALAEKLLAENENSVMPSQFTNPANPDIHARTTAEEIWEDTGGALDALVVGIGTGGTITGCGRVLKERLPDLKVIAVEPAGSPILSGGEPGKHTIQGIGAGFIPDVVERELIDEVIRVPDEDAFSASRTLAKVEGIAGGISTGANLAASLVVGARPEMAGKRVVTFAPSFAERYASTTLFVQPEDA